MLTFLLFWLLIGFPNCSVHRNDHSFITKTKKQSIIVSYIVWFIFAFLFIVNLWILFYVFVGGSKPNVWMRLSSSSWISFALPVSSRNTFHRPRYVHVESLTNTLNMIIMQTNILCSFPIEQSLNQNLNNSHILCICRRL